MKLFAKRAIALLLALGILLGVSPVWMPTAEAATRGSSYVKATEYSVDATDFLALPIEIYDYQADGMIFEFASSSHRIDYFDTWDIPQAQYGWDYSKLQGYKSSLATYSGYMSDYMLNGPGCDLDINSGYRLEVNRTNVNYYLKSFRATVDGNNNEDNYLTLGRFMEDVPKENIRYMFTMTRRYDGTADTTAGVYLRNEATETPRRVATINLTSSESWTYAITDLGDSNVATEKAAWDSIATADYVSISPTSYKDDRLDVACVAFFATESEAEAYSQQCQTGVVRYNTAKDNHGFGLVGGSRNGDDTHYSSVSKFNSYYSIDLVTTDKLDGMSGNTPTWDGRNLFSATDPSANPDWQYALRGIMSKGQATIGLLQPSLSADGTPVYQELTVAYIAGLLQEALEINETYDGNRNYRYVRGVADETLYGTTDGEANDLAQAIRNTVTDTSTIGDYDITEGKSAQLIGKTWAEAEPNIDTYMDAAYFLLNNLFVENAYSKPYDKYDSLRLAKTTIEGQECYVFDGGLANEDGTSATKYDLENRAIYNTSSDYKSFSYYGSGDSEVTTTFPFLPMVTMEDEAGDTDVPYFFDDGASSPNYMFSTYDNRNYNFAMKAQGQFYYEESENLFFEFEGDDDVYLFINGELVLDLGGAHPIATQRININDYVEAARAVVDPIIAGMKEAGRTEAEIEAYMLENYPRDYKLALVDGETYTFDFFYMERKGYGANLKIMTNMKVTSGEIDGSKRALQNDAALPNGSGVVTDSVVEFAFTVYNKSEDAEISFGGDPNVQDNALTNLVFKDPELGLTLSYSDGLVLDGDKSKRLVDPSGGVFEVKDLKFNLLDADGELVYATPLVCQTNEELKAFLALPFGKGVECGQTLTVRGAAIKVQESDFATANKLFTNHLDIETTTDGGQFLTAAGLCQLKNIKALSYYQWAGHRIDVYLDALIDQYNKEFHNAEFPRQDIASITSITVPESNQSDVAVNNVASATDYRYAYLRIKFAKPGTYVVDLTVNYTDLDGIARTTPLPIMVNVVDVQNEVFVLDYGLPVELTKNNALTKNDSFGIAGTRWFQEGVYSTPIQYHQAQINGNNLLLGEETPISTNAVAAFDGEYVIRNHDNSRVLMNQDGSLQPSAVTATTLETTFDIRHVGEGYYTIRSCSTGLYLTQLENGAAVTFADYTGSENQQWLIESVPMHKSENDTTLVDGYLRIVNRMWQGQNGTLACSTTSVLSQARDTGYSKKFTLVQAQSLQLANETFKISSMDTANFNGWNLFVTRRGNNHEAPLYLQQYGQDLFVPEHVGGGWYTIRNQQTNLFLAVWDTDNTTVVQQHSLLHADNELWRIIKNDDDSYRFQNKANNRYMTVATADTTPSDSIGIRMITTQAYNTDAAHQRWKLEPCDTYNTPDRSSPYFAYDDSHRTYINSSTNYGKYLFFDFTGRAEDTERYADPVYGIAQKYLDKGENYDIYQGEARWHNIAGTTMTISNSGLGTLQYSFAGADGPGDTYIRPSMDKTNASKLNFTDYDKATTYFVVRMKISGVTKIDSSKQADLICYILGESNAPVRISIPDSNLDGEYFTVYKQVNQGYAGPVKNLDFRLDNVANATVTYDYMYLGSLNTAMLTSSSTTMQGETQLLNGAYVLSPVGSDNLALAPADRAMSGTPVPALRTVDDSSELAVTIQCTYQHSPNSASAATYYYIQSNYSDKYLHSNGTAATFQPNDCFTGQMWDIKQDGDGYVISNINKTSGGDTVYLSLPSGTAAADGVQVTLVTNKAQATRWKLNEVNQQPNNGTFTYDNASGRLDYKPNGDVFMEQAETVYMAIRVHETDFAPSPIGVTDICHEVEVYKAITVMPANVVYYEDDFPAITYPNSTGNVITVDGQNARPDVSNNCLFIDFTEDTVLHEVSDWIESECSLSIDTSGTGIATVTVAGSKGSPYIRNSTKTDYVVRSGDIIAVRVRSTVNEGSAVAWDAKFWYKPSTQSSLDETYRSVVAESDVTRGQWQVLNFGAVDAGLVGKTLDQFQFSDAYKRAEKSTRTGSFLIDYIYVGPAAGLEAVTSGWEDLEQDNDQTAPYGSDSHYQNSDQYSGTGYHKIEVKRVFTAANLSNPDFLPDAMFSFAGTGFELISRTNATDSATLIVRVKDSTGKQVKLIPVVTEFDNQNVTEEELYQVPVVKVEGLTFGTYTVEIFGMTAYEYDENGNTTGNVRPTYFYLDGIRIYNPLGGSALTNEYDEDEQQATFMQLRKMLIDKKLLTVTWTEESFSAGTNSFGYTENRNGFAYDPPGQDKEPAVYDGKAQDIDDYLLAGPNNEMYISSESARYGIVMYVKGSGALQVGMRLINDDKYYGVTENSTTGEKVIGADTAKVYLGTGSDTASPAWIALDENLAGSTEQYYDIDFTQCPTEDGYYRVVIAVDPEQATGAIVSFTNVKYSGDVEFREVTGQAATICFGDDGKMYRLTSATGGNSVAEQVDVLNSETDTGYEWVELTEEEAADYVRLDLLEEQVRNAVVTEVVDETRNGLYLVDGQMYYFVNGRVYGAAGLVELDGKLYYIRSNGTPATGTYWITNTNGLVPQGFYTFGDDGVMIRETELSNAIVAENGGLYYYVDGQICYGAGLILLDGSYYYIRSSGQAATGLYWVTNANDLMPQGLYNFGADGRMILPEEPAAKNGIIEENGGLYYYVDGNIVYGAGLILLDGSYYYIRSNGQAATGLYWVTNTNGLLAEGFYEFGENGQMIAPCAP